MFRIVIGGLLVIVLGLALAGEAEDLAAENARLRELVGQLSAQKQKADGGGYRQVDLGNVGLDSLKRTGAPASPASQSIRVREIVLVDESGRETMVISGCSPQGIIVYDSARKPRIFIGIVRNKPKVALCNAKGEVRAAFWERNGGYEVWFSDITEACKAAFGILANGRGFGVITCERDGIAWSAMGKAQR